MSRISTYLGVGVGRREINVFWKVGNLEIWKVGKKKSKTLPPIMWQPVKNLVGN